MLIDYLGQVTTSAFTLRLRTSLNH